MKTIVVSGVSGYVGNNFIKEADTRYNIIALGRNKERLKQIQTANEHKFLTYEEFFEEQEKLDGNTIFINFAFPRTQETKELIEALNFTEKVYKKVLDLGVKHFINISSQSIYDYTRNYPAKETDLPHPFDLYGVAKVYSEKYIEDFSKKYDANYINIRLGSVIGPGFNQRFVNKLAKKVVNNEDIQIMDNEYKHSYIFIDDLVKNICSILDSNIEWNTDYNLGSDQKYTISEVMDKILDISKDYKGTINKTEASIKKPYTNNVDNGKINKFISPYFDTLIDDAISKIYIYELQNMRGL